MAARRRLSAARGLWLAAAGLLLLVSAATAAAGPAQWPEVTFLRMRLGVNQMTQVTNAGDGSGRLFLLQQTGYVWIVQGNQVLAAPFLDISSRVNCCGEQGLLGLAFAPDFASNGRFYVYYTGHNNRVVLERHFVSAADPNRADPARSQVVLTVQNNVPHHNGGHLAFGPDGYLYIGVGDDGWMDYAQNPAELRGKLLRIQVEPVYHAIVETAPHRVFLPVTPQASSTPFTYEIPPDNPFVQAPGHRPEIWALGLRNPWRIAFDVETGDLYISDVGQDAYEEINFERAGDPGGHNYGWPIMEGKHCFDGPTCNSAGLTPPVWEYTHEGGNCSVIGGEVYRDDEIPDLAGAYLFGDFCSGRVWGLRAVQGVWQSALLYDAAFGFSSFGLGEDRTVYLAEYASRMVWRLAPAPP